MTCDENKKKDSTKWFYLFVTSLSVTFFYYFIKSYYGVPFEEVPSFMLIIALMLAGTSFLFLRFSSIGVNCIDILPDEISNLYVMAAAAGSVAIGGFLYSHFKHTANSAIGHELFGGRRRRYKH